MGGSQAGEKPQPTAGAPKLSLGRVPNYQSFANLWQMVYTTAQAVPEYYQGENGWMAKFDDSGKRVWEKDGTKRPLVATPNGNNAGQVLMWNPRREQDVVVTKRRRLLTREKIALPQKA